jgi:sec-independent protein translocase protein TatC
MKRANPEPPDPDDMFADTRMSFGEHIEDLRTHLLRAIYGFLIGFVIAIPISPYVLRFISAPVELQLNRYNERVNRAKSIELRKQLENGELNNLPRLPIKLNIPVDTLMDIIRQRLNLPPEDVRKKPVLDHMQTGIEKLLAALDVGYLVDWSKLDKTHYVQISGDVANPVDYIEGVQAINHLIRPDQLKTFSVQEPFMVFVKVILVTGLVIASPWVFIQIWSFIAAGLYRTEKRLVNVYLPFSLILFLVGVFTCELAVIPKAIEAMLWFNEYLGFQPDVRLSEWLGFAILMPVVFGVSFQTPLIMYFMEKIGLFTVESYKNKRRIAWFVLAIFAAVMVPSSDAFSMLMLWVPMCLLYELGILLCIFSPRPPAPDWETSESEEMIEV